jgi:hypothetical protein
MTDQAEIHDVIAEMRQVIDEYGMSAVASKQTKPNYAEFG